MSSSDSFVSHLQQEKQFLEQLVHTTQKRLSEIDALLNKHTPMAGIGGDEQISNRNAYGVYGIPTVGCIPLSKRTALAVKIASRWENVASYMDIDSAAIKCQTNKTTNADLAAEFMEFIARNNYTLGSLEIGLRAAHFGGLANEFCAKCQ